MTPLRRLAFLASVTLFGAVALPVGCGQPSGIPPLPPGENLDSSADGTLDGTHPKRDASVDVVGIDVRPDIAMDSVVADSKKLDVVSTDASTNCSSPTKNGSETDVGCGGPVCPACVVGKHCLMDTDCATPAVCDVPDASVVGVCELPTCHDGMKDGQETGIDCGGPTCPACPAGQGCLSGTDCQSLVCTSMICQAPTCSDGVKNGTETDVDCGGSMCPPCIVGKQCMVPTDCTSDICTMDTCSCPPNMVIVPTNLSTGGDYCVDWLEVTYSEYNTFWISNPSLATQVSYCSWNTTWTPANDWPPDLVTTDPGYNGGYPVNWVNWCQAYAYCEQQGKRLCGGITGGSNPPADSANSMMSQWYNACSADGVNTYPYGNTYLAGRCNDDTVGDDAPWAELNFAGMLENDQCQGGASGLYQMSGNVAEWEDSCSAFTGATDTCLLRGGSFDSSSSGLTCATAVPTARDYQGADSGFRCCL
jgi:hypothetical protein